MTQLQEGVAPPVTLAHGDEPPGAALLHRNTVLRVSVTIVDAVALIGVLLLFHVDAAFTSAYAGLALFAASLTRAHRPRIAPSIGNELRLLLGHLAWPTVFIGALFSHRAGLPQFLRAVPVAMLAVVVGRWLAYLAIRFARAKGFGVERTLIIGSGRVGSLIAELLVEHPEYGLRPVGFLDRGSLTENLGLPVFGELEQLEDAIVALRVDRVLVAYGLTRSQDMVEALRACDLHDVEVHVVPRMFELGLDRGEMGTDDIWGIPVVRVKRAARRSGAWRTKRVFDVVVASAALVVSAPLFVLIGAAVKWNSPGPVFFRQRRVGKDGRDFYIVKFRTLPVNDDSDHAWTVASDERLTPIGNVLRRTSLDELPQLINVLRGEMSLVGPRPERRHFVEQFNATVPGYDARHRVPTGMTGLAQVHQLRGDTSIEERARFDNHYIEHWSLWRDVVILVRTIGAVIKGTHH